MLVHKVHITQFLPHREPFIMVDNLVDFKEGIYSSNLEIREDNFFYVNSELSDYALIENFAQTCAVAISYSKLNTELNINDGFLAAIKNLEFYNSPKLKTIITTEIKLIQQFGKMFLFHGKSFEGSTKFMQGFIKISGTKTN